MSAEYVGERTFINNTMNICVYTKTMAYKMTPISLAEEEYSSMIAIQKKYHVKQSENYDLAKYVA